MKSRLRVALLLLLAVIPCNAWAAVYNLTPADLGVVAAPLTSSPSFTLRADGYASLTVYVAYTRVSATTVNMVCTSGPTQSVQARLGVANVNGTTGAISMAQASWSYPVTSSTTLRVIVAPLADAFITCTFSGAGAAAGDVISVYGRLGGTP